MDVRFYFERPSREAIKLAWGHGRYFDAWSVVHVVTGLLTGIALIGLGVPQWLGLPAIIVVAVLYEGLEMALGIIENVGNVVVDVILAALGTGAAYWWFGGWDVTALALAFGVVAALDVTLVFLGWRHHLRALFQARANGPQRAVHSPSSGPSPQPDAPSRPPNAGVS